MTPREPMRPLRRRARMPRRRRPRIVLARLAPAMLLAMLLAALLAACSVVGGTSGAGGAGAAASGPATLLPPPPAPSSMPAPPSDTPGAVGGNPGSGVTPMPVGGVPGAPSGPLMPVQPPIDVVPTAGLQNVHSVSAEGFTVDGSSGTIRVTIRWWSGPAPCSVLSEVRVERSDTTSGRTFTLTVLEGAAQLGVACPALATHKQTTVDLGPIGDQNWTINVTGVDQPQSIQLPSGR